MLCLKRLSGRVVTFVTNVAVAVGFLKLHILITLFTLLLRQVLEKLNHVCHVDPPCRIEVFDNPIVV